ncbi:MAG: hypothetical protein WAW61_19400 [Methylococcaceae bacterium]
MSTHLNTAFLVVSLALAIPFANGAVPPSKQSGRPGCPTSSLIGKPGAFDVEHLPPYLQDLNLDEDKLGEESPMSSLMLLLLTFCIVVYIVYNYDTTADYDDPQWDSDDNFRQL